MNQHIPSMEQITMNAETDQDEQAMLRRWGFTPEQIASLLWLQQWYQDGDNDRTLVARYLEFLRLLVRSGELEL